MGPDGLARGAGDGGEGRLLSGWGRTAPTFAEVHRPRTMADLERLVETAGFRGLIARGLGRSYGDAAQNAGGRVVLLSGLGGLETADAPTDLASGLAAGRVTVGAGTSLDTLMRALVPRGWFMPVTPGTRQVTVGGAIASDVHGKNHHVDGGFTDHVDSMDLLAPGGGPVTVTRGSEDGAFRATAGGMGLTGVIVQATLRLLPVQTSRLRLDTDRASDLDDLMARMEEGDHRYRYSVAWIDCLARGRHLGRGVLARGDHAGLDELSPKDRRDPLRFAPRHSAEVPPLVPSGLLRPATARVFNEAWFRKAPRLERGRLQPLSGFFHPLDAVGSWNRLYGPRGFVQYQFVVPFGREDAVRAALELLSAANCPSFLGVLKRFGPGHGMLSFPVPGWTLALDIPASAPELGPTLDRLDDMVAEAGGRVYLAKDARLRPELLGAMYPELDRWREVRARLDPGHVLRSDLDRRLGLSDVGGPAAPVRARPRAAAAT
ncbi:MAG: FAD-binding oxidoreductase [Actinomycetota bacterium]|nr:FAD-binding oxidoreductase [Actinomycetota bacterium]